MSSEPAKGPPFRSGERAPRTGLYLPSIHRREEMTLEILVRAGDLLPKCSQCNQEVEWEYVGEFSEGMIENDELILGV